MSIGSIGISAFLLFGFKINQKMEQSWIDKNFLFENKTDVMVLFVWFSDIKHSTEPMLLQYMLGIL